MVWKTLDDLEPNWDLPFKRMEGQWAASKKNHPGMLVISGPSRNGNHLIHSLLDNHPELPRTPGEDSFIAAFFEGARNGNICEKKLRGGDNLEHVLRLSGFGIDKWRKLTEANTARQVKTAVWSGVQKGNETFSSDYQDTIIEVNYAAYRADLERKAQSFRNEPLLVDIFEKYWSSLALIDPHADKRANDKYKYLLFGSGMRAELFYLYNTYKNIQCLSPIRPFSSYYFSFAKGQTGTVDVVQSVVDEAWEHWRKKVMDYLILSKMFPGQLCILNYNDLIADTENTMRKLCDYLDISFHKTCLEPSTLGIPVKGNSSFSQSEEQRGKVYRSKQKHFPSELLPEGSEDLWKLVEQNSL